MHAYCSSVQLCNQIQFDFIYAKSLNTSNNTGSFHAPQQKQLSTTSALLFHIIIIIIMQSLENGKQQHSERLKNTAGENNKKLLSELWILLVLIEVEKLICWSESAFSNFLRGNRPHRIHRLTCHNRNFTQTGTRMIRIQSQSALVSYASIED